ncbi:bifunctional DNA primase/polymerase [Streptomyces sp. NPDC005438]|uniref:bifunctional DNA primase/polymerase n=1 Tax=Streptomyces sp. NPDC005438 TaxID=3156880 RepID=UPI0033BBC3A3
MTTTPSAHSPLHLAATPDPAEPAAPEHSSALVTPDGTRWLASASGLPRSALALWSARPSRPVTLPCGRIFDVLSASPLLGRRLLERLWRSGPGSGPVATHRGRLLLFVRRGTADRLPTLLDWEEWSGRCSRDRGDTDRPLGGGTPAAPGLLCHGLGDAVTVPSPYARGREGCRWLVAPDVRKPWLPGAEAVLWALLRGPSGQVTGGGETGFRAP